jgi:hypothetical protein
MNKEKIYKITIHDTHPRDRIKVSILEYKIKKVTTGNYILHLYNDKTRRITIRDVNTVNAERAYIFDLSLVDEKVAEIISLRKKRLEYKQEEISIKLKQLEIIEVNRDGHHIEDFR